MPTKWPLLWRAKPSTNIGCIFVSTKVDSYISWPPNCHHVNFPLSSTQSLWPTLPPPIPAVPYIHFMQVLWWHLLAMTAFKAKVSTTVGQGISSKTQKPCNTQIYPSGANGQVKVCGYGSALTKQDVHQMKLLPFCHFYPKYLTHLKTLSCHSQWSNCPQFFSIPPQHNFPPATSIIDDSASWRSRRRRRRQLVPIYNKNIVDISFALNGRKTGRRWGKTDGGLLCQLFWVSVLGRVRIGLEAGKRP